MGAPQIAGPSFVRQTAPRVAEFDNTGNSAYWMISVSGNLYLFQMNVATSPGLNGCGFYKSSDGGNTWTALDVAGSPTNSIGVVCYDPSNNRIIAAITRSDVFPRPIRLVPFDLTTETWKPDITSVGPSAYGNVEQVFLRPDGTIAVLYDFGPGNPGGTSRLRGAVWNGVAWGAFTDVGINSVATAPSGNTQTGNTAVMDTATGNIHIGYFAGSPSATDVYYQCWLSTNALGSFNHLGTVAGFSISTFHFGGMTLFNGSIYIPYVSHSFVNNSVFVGSPIAAPVWSSLSPSNMTYPGGLIEDVGSIVADSFSLYWVVNFATDGTFTNVAWQIFTSTDGVTWGTAPGNDSPPYLYDSAISPTVPGADFSFGIANPSIILIPEFGVKSTVYVFGLIRGSSGFFTSYFANAQIFPAPAGPIGSSPILNPAQLPVVTLPNPRTKC